MSRGLRLTLALIALASTGCGLARLHTAKTTPQGTYDVVLGLGGVSNEMIEERGVGVSNFPPQLAVRYGATERLDVGASMFMLSGLLADAKYNLLDPNGRWAVSLLGGIGGGLELTDLFNGSERTRKVLRVPVAIAASYELVEKRLSPYASLGYGAFWVFGAEPRPRAGDAGGDGARLASRKGWGDGMLTLHVGAEIHLGGQGILLEYALLEPVLDDPGDGFAFARNHLVSVGVRL